MSPPRDVVCFGEVLIRLTAPGSELLLQSKRLDVCFGGAEANVAVSLARFGHRAGVVSVLPANPLGRAALDELRRYGVDVSGLRFAEGRMGLYFLQPGAVLRPSEITYDRAGSAFAEADAGLIDWDAELAGARWLHLSGVTPAVGPNAAEAALNAVAAARRQGVKVSFDGNYRAKLWAAWKGDGPAILKELMGAADLAFVDDRDVALVLGRAFADDDRAARRRAAAQAAFEAFPNLQRMASTFRVQHGVDHHELSGVMFARGGAEVRTGAFHLTGVVDRIGGGDAFAAGLMHGLLSGMDDRAALDFAVAAGCLKHSVPGDFNLVGVADVDAFLTGGGLDVRR